MNIAATIANSVSIANTAITPKTMTMKTLEMFQQTSVDSFRVLACENC